MNVAAEEMYHKCLKDSHCTDALVRGLLPMADAEALEIAFALVLSTDNTPKVFRLHDKQRPWQ
jgi:hypothetical protein